MLMQAAWWLASKPDLIDLRVHVAQSRWA